MEQQIRRSRRLAGLTPDPLDALNALKGVEFPSLESTTVRRQRSSLCDKAVAVTLFVGFYAWLFSNAL